MNHKAPFLLFFYSIGLIFLCSQSMPAQDQEIASPASQMFDKVYEALTHGDQGLAKLRLDSMEEMAQATNDYSNAGRAREAKGEFKKMLGNLKGALHDHRIAFKYFSLANDTADCFDQIITIGEIYRGLGQLDSAFFYYEQANEFDESYNSNGIYNKDFHFVLIGRAHLDANQFDEAIRNYILALEAAKKYGRTTGQFYNIIAHAFLQQQNFDLAAEYLDQLFPFSEELDPFNKGTALAHKTTIAISKRQYKEAENFAKEALEYFIQFNHATRQRSTKIKLADALFLQKKYVEAKKVLNELKEEDFDPNTDRYNYFIESHIDHAFHENRLEDIPALIERGIHSAAGRNSKANLQRLYSNQAKYYQFTKNFKAQAEALQLSQSLKDSLFNIQRSNYAASLETKYATAQKEEQIAKLELEDELKATRLSNQRYIIFGSIAALVLLGYFLLLVARRNNKIKIQNEIISKALEEKDILMREIHHRVKNNLQLVSSLLGLQGMNVEDESIKEAINAGKSRVMSMALIHQDLYNKENLTSVNVKDYLEKLCRELIATYNISNNKIKLITAIEDIDLDVESLVPLGLIINELLTNSIKYAFPDGQKGEITIALFEKEGTLKMEIKDNGIGIKDSEKNSSSFGFKLIKSLLRQLDGKMQQHQNQGSHFEFQFKDYKKSA